jgi:hypothetical protein
MLIFWLYISGIFLWKIIDNQTSERPDNRYGKMGPMHKPSTSQQAHEVLSTSILGRPSTSIRRHNDVETYLNLTSMSI